MAENDANPPLVEATIIGSILYDPDTLDEAATIIGPGDFSHHVAGEIFHTIVEMANEGQFVDFVTVSNRTTGAGIPLSILSFCAEQVARPSSVKSHAMLLRAQSVRRAMRSLGAELIQHTEDVTDASAEEYIAHAEAKFTAMSTTRSRVSAISLKQGLPEVVDNIEARYRGTTKTNTIATPWHEVNTVLCGGVAPGDLVVVAGRPSMGKTAYALGIAEQAAADGIPTMVYSLEMPNPQLIERQIASRAQVSLQELRTGRLGDDSWPRLAHSSARLSALPLFYNDHPSRTASSIISESRMMRRRHGIGLVVIDYLQLLELPNTKETKADKLAEVTRQLKLMAKELEIPVILLSQVNRDCESRMNKRPMLSDLRNSGSIEQDADVVMLLFREEVYDDAPKHKNIAEVDIAKQRNGPIGMVRLGFRKAYTRFIDYDPATVHMDTEYSPVDDG